MTENAIAKEIVDAAFRTHTTLGPVYHAVLTYELAQGGLQSVSQRAHAGDLRYDSNRYRVPADLIIEDRVIVEIKSIEALALVGDGNNRYWYIDQNGHRVFTY